MVSTMEDEVIATVSIILLCAAMKLLKKRKTKRNCWKHNMIWLFPYHIPYQLSMCNKYIEGKLSQKDARHRALFLSFNSYLDLPFSALLVRHDVHIAK
jgi:hypothetical protein